MTKIQLKKLRSLWKDSAFTLTASAFIIILNIILTGLLSRGFVSDDFENYLFIRRFIAFIFPLTTLSAGTGLTVILSREIGAGKSIGKTLKGTLFIIAVFNTVILALALLIPDGLTRRILLPLPGQTQYLWEITFCWLTAYSFYILLYSYYRGRLKIVTANILSLFMNAVAPLMIYFYLDREGSLSISKFLLFWAVTYSISVFFLLFHAKNFLHEITKSVKHAVGTVFSYSAPRIPAGIFLAANPFIIPYFLKKNSDDTVFFLSGFLVLQSIRYLTEPLAQAFLPRFAFWYGNDEHSKIADTFTSVFSFSLHIGIIMTVQIMIWGKMIAVRWFGTDFETAGSVISYLSLAIIPTLLYSVSRSVLDAIEQKALITKYLSIGTAICIISCCMLYYFQKLNIITACAIIIVSQSCVIILILAALNKRLSSKIAINYFHLFEICLLSAVGGVFSYILYSQTDWPNSILISLINILSSSSLCLVLLTLWCMYRKPTWWQEFKRVAGK